MTHVVASLFITHFVEMLIFATGMYCSSEVFHIGSLLGNQIFEFHDFVYYSMATYTSLGLGDIYPIGELRILTGLEALTGLLMIGWSASFLFVEMRALEDRLAKSNDASIQV